MFYDYFSFDAILDILIKYRVKLAFQIHKVTYLDGFTKNQSDSINLNYKAAELAFLGNVLPPRKHWSRPRLVSERKSLGTALEINRRAIKNAVFKVHRRFVGKEIGFLETPIWYQNLRKLMFDLRAQIFQSQEVKIGAPEIIPKAKNKKGVEMRPIANFDIRDKIILSITNKYLTGLFDPVFLNCSTAFRQQIDGVTNPKHHDAIKRLKKFREFYISENLFVAECDIQKFFDCVDHTVIKQQYARLKKLLEANGFIVDKVAERILFAFLKCYSFNIDVYPKNNEDAYWIPHKKKGHFGWTSSLELAFKSKQLDTERIGIPQGGALSGLIVNIIMHQVDEMVMDASPENSLYLRYCDDMVIVSQSEQECSGLFDIYQNGLKKLTLEYHQPIELRRRYGKHFWGDKVKSRPVYLWSKLAHPSNVPHSKWVSFLGYMMGFDGQIKIRKKSIEKQIEKHRKELGLAIRKLNNINSEKLTEIQNSVLYSFQCKLYSMAVGKVDLSNYREQPAKMCWGDGFKLIENNKYVRQQLKKLDRSRGETISSLKRYLNERCIPIPEKVEPAIVKKKRNPKIKYPHSFYSLLERKLSK